LRGTSIEPNLDNSFCGAEFWKEYWWSRSLRRVSLERIFEDGFCGTEFEKSIGGAEF
jgi:hypothetical protein